MRIVPAIVIWCLLAASVLAADVPPNPQAIADVAAGKLAEAKASWWGFNAQDATASLQEALRSKAPKLVIDKMDSPWIVDKLELVNDNMELWCEPGVVLQAKKGAFRGPADCLVSAWNRSNIRIVAYDATWRMHRADYDGPDYKHAEWRHVLSLRGCTNIQVLGVTLAESGGDGIYLGTGRKGETNRDIAIRDVICDRNYRQGISVITAENLAIENCILRNTAGTPPAAGIDFEPNHPGEKLVNCVLRSCAIEDNQGLAIHVYARQFDATTTPISLRIENCITRGTNQRSLSLVTSCGPKGPLTGTIDVVNCRFEDVGKTGITIGSNAANGVKIRFADCLLTDAAETPPTGAPIVLTTRKGDTGPIGGVEFVNLKLEEQGDRPLMKYHDAVGLPIADVRGTLVVDRGGHETTIKLDQAALDRWMPVDPVLSIARRNLDVATLRPVPAPATPESLRLPPHRLRDQAIYLLYAKAGQKVTLKFRQQAVGRTEMKPAAIEVLSPAEKRAARFAVEGGQDVPCEFTATETGVYRVIALPLRHTIRLLESSHRVSVIGEGNMLHSLGTATEFYFLVPAGTKAFGVRVMGEGEAECVKATVFDARGAKVWEQDSIGPSKSYRNENCHNTTDEVWKVRLDKASTGVFEDNYLELRGLPPIVAFHPEALLRQGK